MTFPLVNNVYKYNGQEVIIWGQDPLLSVYCRTYIHDGENIGSNYEKYNWWKFMLNAKYLRKAPTMSAAY